MVGTETTLICSAWEQYFKHFTAGLLLNYFTYGSLTSDLKGWTESFQWWANYNGGNSNEPVISQCWTNYFGQDGYIIM